jgi:DNA-binding HxlR family transcriptional regulator
MWLHLATKLRILGIAMNRANFATAECPVARAVGAVGDGWSLLIVREGLLGKRRFGEFQVSLGVAKNILTVRLQALVAAGIMELVPAADGGARREYALTERGRGLLPVIVAMAQWAGGPQGKVVERKTGRRVGLELRSEGGRKVAPSDVMLVPASDVKPAAS